MSGSFLSAQLAVAGTPPVETSAIVEASQAEWSTAEAGEGLQTSPSVAVTARQKAVVRQSIVVVPPESNVPEQSDAVPEPAVPGRVFGNDDPEGSSEAQVLAQKEPLADAALSVELDEDELQRIAALTDGTVHDAMDAQIATEDTHAADSAGLLLADGLADASLEAESDDAQAVDASAGAIAMGPEDAVTSSAESVTSSSSVELVSESTPASSSPEPIAPETASEPVVPPVEPTTPAVEEPTVPEETPGEELPTVTENEDTLVPTPSQELESPESLPPAIQEEEALEGEDAETEDGRDPELGILRLRERELSLKQPPIKVPVYLLVSASYLSNSNTRASEDPVDDQLFRSTVAVTASPILGRRTAAYATVQGNLFRYGDLSRLDYNELRFRAGIRHVLRSRVIGELGWTNRQLYFRESGDRFLSDNSVFGSISRRDPGVLGPATSLNSFYRVRASFAEPKTSNRVINTIGTTLSYDVTPRLKASLTGLGVVTSFTKQSRHDVYGQALASLSYTVAKNTRFSLFAALNRGGSADDRVDFDNALLGVSFSSSLKLF